MTAAADANVAVFDTNILIDFLNGIEPARAELDRFDKAVISLITWIEVMVGARPSEEQRLRAFLDRFECVPLDAGIAEITVALRRQHRLRLPDAMIWATACARDAVLITRNTRDFPADQPGLRVPYRL
jgi:hypothetical protein